MQKDKKKSNRRNLYGIILVALIGCCLISSVFGYLSQGSATATSSSVPQIVIPTITSIQSSPMPPQEQSMDYEQQLNQALDNIPLITITSVGAFDISGRILVTFQMVDNNLDIAHDDMKKIACAIKSIGTNGYDLRLAGDEPGGVTVLTATISEETINNLDCSPTSVPDWAIIADEYSVASGLR